MSEIAEICENIKNEIKGEPDEAPNEQVDNSSTAETEQGDPVTPNTSQKARKRTLSESSEQARPTKKAKLVQSPGNPNWNFMLQGISDKVYLCQIKRFFSTHGIENVNYNRLTTNSDDIVLDFEHEDDYRKAYKLAKNEMKKVDQTQAKMLFKKTYEHQNTESESGRSLSEPFQFMPSLDEIDIWDTHDKCTYGLSKAWLDSVGVELPLTNWVHVENFQLEENLGQSNLFSIKEVFAYAGVICGIEPRDTTTLKIEYSHPIEALQAISLFHNQELNGHKISVTMCESNRNSKPERLNKIGPGFGAGGKPLRDIMKHLKRNIKGYSSSLENGTSKLNEAITTVEQKSPNINSMETIKLNVHSNESQSSISDEHETSSITDSSKTNTLSKIQTINRFTPKPLPVVVRDTKAMVPNSVADKIVNMIKKGWTANEIVALLNTADSKRMPNNLGPQVMVPNANNSLNNNVRPNQTQPWPTKWPHVNSGAVIRNPGVAGSGLTPRPLSFPSGPMVPAPCPLVGNPGPPSGRIGQVAQPAPPGTFGQVPGPNWNPTLAPSLEPSVYTVQLSNLPLSVPFPFLHDKMSMCGAVKFVKFTDPGCVLVGYANIWEAEKCINMFNKTVVEGREVAVTFVRENKLSQK